MLLQLERDEAANWRSKWAEEATKTDGVKRECMQVLIMYSIACRYCLGVCAGLGKGLSSIWDV